MSFNITPSEYLAMLNAAHAEFLHDKLSIRKIIVCCVLANHLPDFLVAEYARTDPAKLNHKTTLAQYRDFIASSCPQTAIVRDLCDYGKHGPILNRKSATVANTKAKRRFRPPILPWDSFRLTTHVVVSMQDGSTHRVDKLLSDVVDFWNAKFRTDAL